MMSVSETSTREELQVIHRLLAVVGVQSILRSLHAIFLREENNQLVWLLPVSFLLMSIDLIITLYNHSSHLNVISCIVMVS